MSKISFNEHQRRVLEANPNVAAIKIAPLCWKQFRVFAKMHVKKATSRNLNGFRVWLLHVYGERQISIIERNTGRKWEVLVYWIFKPILILRDDSFIILHLLF